MCTEELTNSLRKDGLASGTGQTDQGEALPSAFTVVANPYLLRNGASRCPLFNGRWKVPLHDASLSTKLIEMDRDNIFQDVVTNTSTGMPLAITSLLNACRDMQGMLRREEPEEDDEVSCLYNRTTCFEFHRLLVFTLLSFGKALDGYADAYGKCFEDLLKHAEEVYIWGTLLWTIGYSRILENHLNALHKKRLLQLPANSQENLDKFFKFTKFVRPIGQVIVQLTDNVGGCADEAGNSGEGGVEGGGVDDCGNAEGKDEDERTTRDQVIVQPTDGVDGGADEVGNNGEGGVDGCWDDGGEDEDEEFKTLADKFVSSDNRDLAKSYMEWIRLQVDRFQAPRKIMSFMMRTRTPRVDLTLLAVRCPEPKLAGEVLEPWCDTIRYLCAKSKGVKSEGIIRILKEKIAQGVKKTSKDSIFHKFNFSGTETYKYNATVHCEAALADLDKFPGAVGCDDALRAHIRV